MSVNHAYTEDVLRNIESRIVNGGYSSQGFASEIRGLIGALREERAERERLERKVARMAKKKTQLLSAQPSIKQSREYTVHNISPEPSYVLADGRMYEVAPYRFLNITADSSPIGGAGIIVQ